MYIIKLILEGNKRFELNSINKITLTPSNRFHLILGTNGSGKSSLLNELTPWPPNPNDYHKTGCKIIHIDHNGSHYVLSSRFDPAEHLFEKDGVQLNTGRTVTVQKELVKQEFGIDPNIHELITGQIKFSLMGPAERRSWFTKLSNTNYTFAIGVYSKLKESHRGVVESIKQFQARIVQETNKQITPEQEEVLKKEIEDIRKTIDDVIMEKPNVSEFGTAVENLIAKNLSDLKIASDRIIACRKGFNNNENFPTAEAISDAVRDQEVLVANLDFQISKISEELEGLHRIYNTVKQAGIHSVKDLEERIHALNHEDVILYNSNKLNLVIEDPEYVLRSIETIYGDITYMFSEMSDKNPDINKQNYDKLLADISDTKIQIKLAENTVNQLKVNLRHMEEVRAGGHVTCPKCSYMWINGFDDKAYSNLNQEIENQNRVHGSLEDRLSLLEKKKEEFDNYIGQLQSYKTFTKQTPFMVGFWNYIEVQGIIEKPKNVIIQLDIFKSDLFKQIKYKQICKEIKELEKELELATVAEKNDLNQVTIKLQENENHLYRLNTQRSFHLGEVNKFKQYYKLANEIISQQSNIINTKKSLDENTFKLAEIYKRDGINTILTELRMLLVEREQRISKIDAQKQTIQNIESMLVDLQCREKVLKAMVKELSPTEGLIAKGLNGFINIFVEQVNLFISKVWAYPLELVHDSGEEGSIDLDYKFGIKVNNGRVVPDIKLGSAAMREIIDLAFRICSLKWLGLTESVLMLDELGASFDKEHRGMVNKLIQDITTMSDFSQVYVISHYEEMYGSYKNADVTVLCPANVNVPRDSTFNTCVEIS